MDKRERRAFERKAARYAALHGLQLRHTQNDSAFGNATSVGRIIEHDEPVYILVRYHTGKRRWPRTTDPLRGDRNFSCVYIGHRDITYWEHFTGRCEYLLSDANNGWQSLNHHDMARAVRL